MPYQIEAIVAELLETPGVEKARVYENPTGAAATVANINNVGAHSIMVTVYSREPITVDFQRTLAKVIEDKKAPGVRTFGASSVIRDGRTIRFNANRGTPIKIAITMTYQLGVFPSDGEARIRKALVDHAAANFEIGEKIDVPRLRGAALAVPGWTWSAFTLQDEHGQPLNVGSAVAGNNVYTLAGSDVSIAGSVAT